jgi:hypothetical protein
MADVQQGERPRGPWRTHISVVYFSLVGLVFAYVAFVDLADTIEKRHYTVLAIRCVSLLFSIGSIAIVLGLLKRSKIAWGAGAAFLIVFTLLCVVGMWTAPNLVLPIILAVSLLVLISHWSIRRNVGGSFRTR